MQAKCSEKALKTLISNAVSLLALSATLTLTTMSMSMAPAFAADDEGSTLAYSSDSSVNPSSPPDGDTKNSNASAPASLGDFEAAGADNDGKKIAQGSMRPASRTPLPGVTGTVKIRRPFKLFAQNQDGLIHHLSFRDTPVKDVITEIARRGNVNIIIDKSCSGKITGDLRDVSLNEAMDNVLAAAGLQSRLLDNSTIVVGSTQAMVQLGLNRPMARAFKLSYSHPYDVAALLSASIFNKGYLPDFKTTTKRQAASESTDETATEKQGSGPGSDIGGPSVEKSGEKTSDREGTKSDTDSTQSYSLETQPRTLRGVSRAQTQEGVGFNNAATDPGTQQIRANLEIAADFSVDPNGGGAIVIPDVKGRQVIVVGTADDVNIAEEAIRLIDKRPKQVHIQASLIELNNQGIRQLGATLNLQGEGLSSSIMGNSQAPLKSYLPGLGSPANSIPNPDIPAIPFTGSNVTNGAANGAGVPAAAYSGLIGSLVPLVAPTIAGVNALTTAQSAFNFLAADSRAGGRANIATVPHAINLSVNLLLQTNKAKLIANPSVVVVDNSEALITIASEVIHKVTSTVSLGVVTTNVELTKAGIFLNVLPKVTQDGFITMRLRPQVSTPIGAPQVFGPVNAPTVVVTLLNYRDIMAQEVRIKDGQTLVLGGLFTENEAAQMAKTPYLAEAPVLGAFFRNTIKGRNRTELMLLITPKIVEEDPTSSLAERRTSTSM
jgi:type II secretory pathway component GspD/PulD (secretin)